LIRAWKTAGALVRLKSMTRYSPCPVGVLKAIFNLSPSQMTGVTEIQLGENRCPLKQFEGRSNEWEGVRILDRDVIEAPVVDAGPL